MLPPGVGAETHVTNPSIPPNEVVLHFVDGQTGDLDMTNDGTIVDPGAPAMFLPVASLTRKLAGPLHHLKGADSATLAAWVL
jgi:hypothetical protein